LWRLDSNVRHGGRHVNKPSYVYRRFSNVVCFRSIGLEIGYAVSVSKAPLRHGAAATLNEL